MFAVLLRLEFRKLSGTLALTLCLLAPALVALVGLLIALRQPAHGWSGMVTNIIGLWAYFVLPLTSAALAALLGQIEHGPRCWDHLFALPVSRPKLILAKAAVMMTLLAGMSLALVALGFALGRISGLAGLGGAPRGTFPWAMALALAGASWAAAWLMAAIELWLALRFRSFVPPIAAGLAGTFVLVASMGGPQAIVLPWAMPLAALGLPGGNPSLALALGGGLGLAAMLAMAAHLARREL